ncbi:Spy/CpxP family protein refolding chaperone [Xanthobacter sp. KR7-65]|uniref:Spy/CpxP family protein refolding chaperone n=1 Tax=Xanthobacter sp. KR7-65 TaxID=3156612 RepID=UPI0032B52BFE
MRSFRLFALASVMGTVLACGVAAAQPAPAPGMGPGPASAGVPYTPEDAAAILDARLAALKTVLRLTPDQEKLWPPVETAIRDAVKGAIARREARASAPPPATVLDVLAQVAAAEQARGKALATFVDAAKPFVAALTPAQVNRIPTFLGVHDHGQAPSSTELWIFEEEE